MLAFVALAVLQQSPSALLESVRKHYCSLKTFSMTIEHHDDTGLFPGEYTQKLQFEKEKRFELKVTKPNPKEISGLGGKAPDYYCDGTIVWQKGPGQLLSQHTALNRNPN